MLCLTSLSIIIIILLLPVGDQTHGQLLGLLGLSLTAIITLASTTFFANAMAGLMIRSVASFKPGDFISVDEHFGRVTERGLFHTEIQTEDRDLTTIPNLFITTHPVKVVHATGTIISADVSLGYDVSHSRVEPLMMKAVEKAELTDPFVHVTDLGDFSVSYRVAGFLEDVRHVVSVRSRLRQAVLDELHGADIEIASPTIMLQRPMMREDRIIPQEPICRKEGGGQTPEDLIFDKAEEAASVQALRDERAALLKEVDVLADEKADATEIQALKAKIDTLATRLKASKANDADNTHPVSK